MEVREVFVVITLAVFNICWGAMASLPVRTLAVIETNNVAGTSLPRGGIRKRCYSIITVYVIYPSVNNCSFLSSLSIFKHFIYLHGATSILDGLV